MSTHLIDAFNILESVNKSLGEWVGEAIAGQNLTLLDFRVLDSLAQGRVMTTEQCCKHLNAMPTKVSLRIDKLEKSGYLQRRREKPDRRRVSLQLTDKGLEVYELALGMLSEQWQKKLSSIGAEILQFTAVFAGCNVAPMANLVKNLLKESK